jgi:predicted dehydrogenase
MTKVGIVGTGWGARVQTPAFREAGLEVAGPVGRADWRRLIDRSDIDLISIVMPPSMHLEIATAALAAGKHVVNEKPTALNSREAEKLLAASRSHRDRIAIVDHELRFLPAWIAARKQMSEIGGVRYVEVRYASPSRGDRSRAWNWWSDEANGGGVWGAVGSHFVDTIRYLGLEIEAVQAMLHTAIKERPGGVVTSDDFAAVHLRLSGGAVAAMTFSAVASGPDEATVMTIHGEHGALRLREEELLFAKPKEAFRRIAGGDLQNRPGNSPGGAFGTGTLLLGQALRASLEEGKPDALAPAATFEDGLAQQRVLDAARQSARAGGWVGVEEGPPP